MKINRLVPLCFILILFFSGCKTTRIIQPGKQVTEPVIMPAGELRGFAMHPVIWIHDDPYIMEKNIIMVIEKVAGANYNSVFFQLNGKTDYRKQGFDPLAVAIETAHKYNLKIYAGIDIAGLAGTEPAISQTEVIPGMKNKIYNLTTSYNIDGLSMVPGNSSPDLIEELVVEALLVKPYLVNSLVYTGANEYQNAAYCLEKGIIDLIINDADFGITDTDSLPSSYPDKINSPDNLKKNRPEQVIGLDLSALFPDNPGGQTVYINKRSKTKITDSEGHIGFIISDPDTIVLETAGRSVMFSTENWNIPFKYSVQPDGKVVRKSPWVEFRNMPERFTDLPEYDLLCKTVYPASVWINGDSVKLYKTGIFFNKVSFNEGPNRVRATVLTHDSLSVFYENEFIFHKTDKTRKPFPLWINERTVEPGTDIELLAEDAVRVSFQGSPGQEAFIEVIPGKERIKCSREDYGDYSLYKGEIPLQELKAGKPYKIILKLIPSAGAPDDKTLELVLKHQVIIRDANGFPYIKIVRENSRLTYNLGAPRLGGPIRSELQPGVIMKTNGKIGDNYRVRLSRTENGYVSKDDVQLMPAETIQPLYYISSMSCGPGKDADVLTIPYPEPVPYEVYPDPDQNRIVIKLFGVETSSTWITHMEGRKIIDKITWQQTTPETYQIYVNLKTPEIWGYSFRQEGKRLVLRLRYPPEYDLNNEKSLTGLKIAIEAGHGGSGTGAIGLSGLVEKDINLDLSLRLGELLKSKGAEIVQARDSDKDMGLIEKRNIVESSGADLFVSIHANAGGGGYLRVGGTSTYYHNSFWAPLAENIYSRLLELGLKEFGVVGSFNYTPIRLSQMPSILVEQAFMSNAEDEEKLADSQFREQMAQKIYEGIIDYLIFMQQ
jgi:N-acetylmuramoyl-L-alanine amidase